MEDGPGKARPFGGHKSDGIARALAAHRGGPFSGAAAGAGGAARGKRADVTSTADQWRSKRGRPNVQFARIARSIAPARRPGTFDGRGENRTGPDAIGVAAEEEVGDDLAGNQLGHRPAGRAGAGVWATEHGDAVDGSVVLD